MITQPFNFEAHLRKPPVRFDVVPWIDIGLILLFFGVLHSRWIVAPGIALHLPATAAIPAEALPTSRVLTVQEVQGRERLIFEDKILDLDTFAKLLAASGPVAPEEVLLVRADRDVSTQLMTRIFEIASEAGFRDVLLAAEPEKAVGAAP